jgi:thiamine biosynthesis lipoprotein
VRFANPRTKIGLGAIAKGYLVGRSIALLRSMGISDAIVEAGGDLQVSGSRDGSPWTVGLVHPRNGNVIASIALENGEAIVTSGDYERFVIFHGKRYHHIIDPKTGHPAEGMASVTVLCHDPTEADALAPRFS